MDGGSKRLNEYWYVTTHGNNLASVRNWKNRQAARKIINYAATETGAHGKVTDADTSQALKGVIVEIVELQRLTSTNSKGLYEFRRLPEGNYTIRFRKNGYIISVMPLQLQKDTFMKFDMEIEHQPVAVPA